MKVVGVVVEYNPFHNGHLYHIKKAKEVTGADYVIAIMSGNFVQRGKPAFIDKWARTEMALKAGIDLIIELPVIYATSSAEGFAQGAISLLDKLNVVDAIVFGSECGDINLLRKLADILVIEPYEYKVYLKSELNKGLDFPEARNKAIYKYINDHNFLDYNIDKEKLTDIISSPNNILGIEYLKALNRLDSFIKPFTIKRKSSNYHDTLIENKYSSATAIRKSIVENDDINKIYDVVPRYVYDILKDYCNDEKCPVMYNSFSPLLHYILETNNKLNEIIGANEGIENRIKNFSENSYYISEIIKKTNTKRYTETHINRVILHILLDLKKKDLKLFDKNGGPQYIKILGFNENSTDLLTMIKVNSHLPIISNVKNAFNTLKGLKLKMLKQEIFASNLYAMMYPNQNQRKHNLEFRKPIQKEKTIL